MSTHVACHALAHPLAVKAFPFPIVCFTTASSEDTHTHSCYVGPLSLHPEFLGALTTQH